MQTTLVAEKPNRKATDPVHREIAALIEQRDFAGLERVLGAFQTAFEADAGARLKLETAYEVFDRIPRSALGTLDAWCQSHPNSYAAHMARAALFYHQGLDARGTKFIGKTPEENLRTMRHFFEKAQADLERSLTLTPKPYLSRLTLMSVARIGGSRRGENAHYLEAVKLAPQSIELRLDHMATLEPRWGDSHKAMQAYADESRAQLTDAKAADRLAARIPAYRHGLDANQADGYAQRGWRYQQQKKMDMAFQDYLAAARLGNAWAELMTGKYQWSGWGVQQDRDEALVWFRKAAAKGHPDAKLSLKQALEQLAQK